MGGAIGEWSNSAPRAEPCHWATWVESLIFPKLDNESLPWTHFFWHPVPSSPAAKAEVGIEGASPKP